MIKAREPPSVSSIHFPVTNQAHVNLERLLENLELYESDWYHLFEQVPKIR